MWGYLKLFAVGMPTGFSRFLSLPLEGMSDWNITSMLPNPDVPLAFFAPTEAYETTVSIYTHVATLAVCRNL